MSGWLGWTIAIFEGLRRLAIRRHRNVETVAQELMQSHKTKQV
jgi:hypothetical protein